MAKRPILENTTEKPEGRELNELEWVVAKTLLDANAHTARAFESHLLRTYREDASPDMESMQANIRQAIDEHEKIVEELEVAAQAVAEMRRKQRGDSADE